MSKAFQCDICGRFYAAHPAPFGAKYIIRELSESNDKAEYLDICSSCQSKINDAIDQARTSIQTTIKDHELQRKQFGIETHGISPTIYEPCDDRR